MPTKRSAKSPQPDPESSKRPPPPVIVPQALRYPAPSSLQARDLNVMLNDLGLLRGPITAHYTTHTRNGVSLLQQQLAADGYFSGRPDGSFTADTRAALLADPDIPTST